MNAVTDTDGGGAQALDTGLLALAVIAGHYRIAADPFQLRHELGLGNRAACAEDLVLGARQIGLRARSIAPLSVKRLGQLPLPAMLRSKDGRYAIIAAGKGPGQFRLIDPVLRIPRDGDAGSILEASDGTALLVTRRLGGAGTDPKTFGFTWFLPSIWRYRQALVDVLAAVGDRVVPLTPGMTVTAEIKTDNQRIIEYLLSPLSQTASEALHER